MAIKWVYDDGGRADYYKGQAGDCAVRAISIVECRDYREVYKDLGVRIFQTRISKIRKEFEGKAKSPRNGVPRKIVKEYMLGRGWDWLPIMQIGSGCTMHLREDELPNGRLLVSLSKH